MIDIELTTILEAFTIQKMGLNINGDLVCSDTMLPVKMDGDDIAIVTNEGKILCYIDVTRKSWEYAFTPEGVELMKKHLINYFTLLVGSL